MKPSDLRRWQAAHLAIAICLADRTGWEKLEPVIHLPQSTSSYNPESGEYRRLSHPTFDGPSMVGAEVRGLEPYPAHHIELMRSDYDAYLRELSDAAFDAWLEYVSKARLSWIWAVKDVRRSRVVDGRVVSRRLHRSVQRNTSASALLGDVSLGLLWAANAPAPCALLVDDERLRLESEVAPLPLTAHRKN